MRLATLTWALAPLVLLVSFSEIDCSGTTGVGSLRLLRQGVPPAASSPAGVVRLLEWCWNERDTERYREVFTEDFRFVFAALDDAGHAYRDTPWTRGDELTMFGHVIYGGEPDQPAIVDVDLIFDRDLRATDDPRPGKDPGWHRYVRTSVLLHLTDAKGGQWECSGFANFFVVRGDSALIPSKLVARGFGPDPNRWYVERWDDDTVQGEGLRAMPVSKPTWGSFKALYR